MTSDLWDIDYSLAIIPTYTRTYIHTHNIWLIYGLYMYILAYICNGCTMATMDLRCGLWARAYNQLYYSKTQQSRETITSDEKMFTGKTKQNKKRQCLWALGQHATTECHKWHQLYYYRHKTSINAIPNSSPPGKLVRIFDFIPYPQEQLVVKYPCTKAGIHFWKLTANQNLELCTTGTKILVKTSFSEPWKA